MKENLDIVLNDRGWVGAGSCLPAGEPGAERAPRSDRHVIGKWICKLTGKARQKSLQTGWMWGWGWEEKFLEGDSVAFPEIESLFHSIIIYIALLKSRWPKTNDSTYSRRKGFNTGYLAFREMGGCRGLREPLDAAASSTESSSKKKKKSHVWQNPRLPLVLCQRSTTVMMVCLLLSRACMGAPPGWNLAGSPAGRDSRIVDIRLRALKHTGLRRRKWCWAIYRQIPSFLSVPVPIPAEILAIFYKIPFSRVWSKSTLSLPSAVARNNLIYRLLNSLSYYFLLWSRAGEKIGEMAYWVVGRLTCTCSVFFSACIYLYISLYKYLYIDQNRDMNV